MLYRYFNWFDAILRPAHGKKWHEHSEEKTRYRLETSTQREGVDAAGVVKGLDVGLVSGVVVFRRDREPVCKWTPDGSCKEQNVVAAHGASRIRKRVGVVVLLMMVIEGEVRP